MDTDFAVRCPLVRHWRLLSGFCSSTRMFALRFFQTPPHGDSPCVLTSPSPPSGWAGDFHPQAAKHAQHTTKLALQAALWLLLFGAAAPLRAQGIYLDVCNKGTVPVEVVAAQKNDVL